MTGQPECDPLALRSPFLTGAFRLYLRWYFWRRFHAVRLSRAVLPGMAAGRPLVIYTNHPSWWDPALLLLALPKLFPGRRGFGPMDAGQLERYALFRRMGVFGLEASGAGGAARFLRTARYGLAQPGTCLCITAEGDFVDPRLRPVRLRPGLAHLARLVPDAVFLPLALEYSFWNESRPEALMRFGLPLEASGSTGRGIGEWNAMLEDGLVAAMDGLAAESSARDAALFRPLFRGTSGVGGIYDLWRRGRGAFRGTRFDTSHEPHGR